MSEHKHDARNAGGSLRGACRRLIASVVAGMAISLAIPGPPAQADPGVAVGLATVGSCLGLAYVKDLTPPNNYIAPDDSMPPDLEFLAPSPPMVLIKMPMGNYLRIGANTYKVELGAPVEISFDKEGGFVGVKQNGANPPAETPPKKLNKATSCSPTPMTFWKGSCWVSIQGQWYKMLC